VTSLAGSLFSLLGEWLEKSELHLKDTVEVSISFGKSTAFRILMENLKKSDYSYVEYSTVDCATKYLSLLWTIQQKSSTVVDNSILQSIQEVLEILPPKTKDFVTRATVQFKLEALRLLNQHTDLSMSSTRTHWKRIHFEIATQLLPQLLICDVNHMKFLLNSVIFNKEHLTSFLGEEMEVSILSSFFTTYIESTVRPDPTTFFIRTLSNNPNESIRLLPEDWPFYPIALYYQEKVTSDEQKEIQPVEDVHVISENLQFIHFLEVNKVNLITTMDPSSKYFHLMKVFFLGDAFLDPKVNHYLSTLNDRLCGQCSSFDVSKMSTNFLQDFLNQFANKAYANPTFIKFVFSFLRMENSVKTRRTVWHELEDMYNLLRIEVKHFDSLDLKSFLFPTERDSEMLHKYVNAIAGGKLSHVMSPVLYWVAVHHLSNYLFDDKESQWIREELFRRLEAETPEALKHIFHYKYDGNVSYIKNCIENAEVPVLNQNELQNRTNFYLTKKQ